MNARMLAAALGLAVAIATRNKFADVSALHAAANAQGRPEQKETQGSKIGKKKEPEMNLAQRETGGSK